MAWDFSTDPQFEEQLAWMREFVREEIWPIEAIVHDLDQDQLDRIYAPLQEQVKARGLWAAHLDPELGGQGFGQVKLGLMHEILGSSCMRPSLTWPKPCPPRSGGRCAAHRPRSFTRSCSGAMARLKPA